MDQKAIIAIVIAAVVVVGGGVGIAIALSNGGDSEASYTVKFNVNGGNAIDDKSFTKNTETFSLPDAARDGGYTFLGWYGNADFTGDKITQVEKGTEKDIEVWAKWQLNITTKPSANQIRDNTNVNITYADGTSANDMTIEQAAISEIKAGKEVTVVQNDTVSGKPISWTFTGADDVSADYKTAPQDVSTKVTPDRSELASNRIVTLDFEYDGALPYPSTIRYYIGTDVLQAGTLVSVKNEIDPEPIGQYPVGDDGYIEFTITHCSDWYLQQWITITYDADGGAFNDGATTKQVSGVYGSAVVAPTPAPKRTGYTFGGWEENIDTFLESKTVKATWTVITYTVQFDKNNGGATGTMDSMQVTYEETKSLPQFNFELTGNSAVWNSLANGQGVTIAVDGRISGTQVCEFAEVDSTTVTLYAIWTANEYTMTFNGNGGTTPEPVKVTYGSACGALPVSEYRGFTFDGWNTSANGTGTSYDAETIFNKVAEDVTVYAQWVPITYELRFNKVSEAATGTMANQTVTYGALPAINACGFTSTSQAFAGWALSQGGDAVYADGDHLTADLSYTQGAVIDLFATWDDYNITVTIMIDGERVGNIQSVKAKLGDNAPLVLTYVLARNAYYVNEGVVVSGNYNIFVDDVDTGIVAQVTSGSGSATVEYFTVTFDPNGGTGQAITQKVLKNSTLSDPSADFQKTGYAVDGYMTRNPDGSMTMWNWENQLTDTTILYAHWRAQQYTVSFNTAGGSEVSPVQATFDADMPAISIPSLGGNDFLGFFLGDVQYYDEEGQSTHKWDIANSTTTLVAHWTAHRYNVTINLNGGTVSNDPVEGWSANNLHTTYTKKWAFETSFNDIINDFVTKSGGIEKIGNNLSWDPATGVTPAEDCTIDAVWTLKNYDVFIDLLGGTITPVPDGWTAEQHDGTLMYKKTVQHGTSTDFVNAFSAATKDHYTSDSWVLKYTQMMPSTVTMEDMEFSPVWVGDTFVVMYNSDGGSGTMENGTAVFGSDFSAAACTFTKVVDGQNLRFVRWCTNLQGTGAIFNAGTPKSIDETCIADLVDGKIVLYAQWSEGTYEAQVGDKFTGTYTYNSPDPNRNFTDLPAECVIISTGANSYRMEVLLIDGTYTSVVTVAEYDNGCWPVFGEFGSDIDLDTITRGAGTPVTVTINGASVAATQYSFTLQGIPGSEGTLKVVDETGMLCYIDVSFTIDSQLSDQIEMLAGEYRECITITGFSNVGASNHEVVYYLDYSSDENVTRASGIYLDPEDLGFQKDDKVFVGWMYGNPLNYETYYPGERVLTDRTLYGMWETPNTNISWRVENIPAGMQFLLNGESDAWVSDASVGDYLSIPGTSNWQIIGQGYNYSFTYAGNSYRISISTIDYQSQEPVETISHQLTAGDLRINFIRADTHQKFFVGIMIDQVPPVTKGYLPQVGDTFVYRTAGYDVTYQITRIPGSDGWSYKDRYEYTYTVMGTPQTTYANMYCYPFQPSLIGLYTIEDYQLGNDTISCYHAVSKQITQASGQRSTAVISDIYVGVNDGVMYKITNGIQNATLLQKSATTAITKHTVTFDGNGGEVNGRATATEEVYGVEEVSAYRQNYQLIGWATSAQGEPVYGTYGYIDADASLYAVWYYDGAQMIVHPGKCDNLQIQNFPLSENEPIVFLPDSLGGVYRGNNEYGTFFTMDDYNVPEQASPMFRYMKVQYTQANMSQQQGYLQIAPHVWVNESTWTTNLGMGTPERAVIIVEKGYEINVTLDTAAPVTVTYQPNGAPGDEFFDYAPRYGLIDLAPGTSFNYPGHTFLGWSNDQYGLIKYNSTYPEIDSILSDTTDNGTEITFRAIWAASVTIIYDPLGGQGEYDTNTVVFTLDPLDDTRNKYYLRDSGDYSKSGCTLLGWSNSSDANVLDYASGTRLAFTEADAGRTVRLYAVWGASDDTFNLSFADNQSKKTQWDAPSANSPVVLSPGIAYTMPVVTYTSNYRLIGWTLDPDGTEPDLGVDGVLPGLLENPGELVLYAVWDGVTITFNANGGTGSMNSMNIAYNTIADLPANAFSWNGHVFGGWTSNMTMSQGLVAYENDKWQVCVLDKTLTSVEIRPQWIEQHTVTFIPNGGEFEIQFNTTQTVLHGETLYVPGISKEDFNFYGWVLEDNTPVDFGETEITHDYVVNALWVFTVHYLQWDGEEWVENEELLNEEARNPIALPEIEMTQSDLSVSWNTQYDGEGESFTTDEMQELPHEGAEVYLYEIHILKSFTIHFDSNGSDDVFDDNVFYDNNDVTLSVGEPYRPGYIFTGWYDLRVPERPEGPYEDGDNMSEKFGYYTLTLTAQYVAE